MRRKTVDSRGNSAFTARPCSYVDGGGKEGADFGTMDGWRWILGVVVVVAGSERVE